MTTPARPNRLGLPIAIAALSTLLTAVPLTLAQPAAETLAAPAITVSDHDIARYRQHLYTLSNPFFEGRRPGTRGNDLAADYLEHWFKSLGLLPIFPEKTTAADGAEVLTPRASYRQAFPYGRDIAVEHAALTITPDAGEPVSLTRGRDFEVLGISGTGSARGEVVFAGYAINGGPHGFTSFPPRSADALKGKIALVMRFEPIDDNGRSRFTGNAWSNAAALSAKFRTLADRGAAAIILTSPPGADDPRINDLETTAATTRIARQLDIPVVMMTMDAADALVRAADTGENGPATLMDLRKIADEGAALVTLRGVTVDLAAAVGRPERTTENVAALLPGKGGLADQYIVVGAHFDHVGDGSLGGSRSSEPGAIHYGADDNASGAAGLLLAAEQLTSLYASLPDDADARSIIFMGFNAEEIGLVGSRYYVQNSPIDAPATYAMVNMDMIGRLRDNRLEVHGTGTAEGFEEFLRPIFAASGLEIGPQPGGRGPSDHASFYAAGVPVLHLFTGLHEEYHTPRDVADLINIEGGAHVASLAARITFALATRQEPLVFRSTDRARADAGDPHAGQEPGSGLGGVRVRFGISPGSYSDGEPGVLVGEVFPGTSAADAGVQKGDRLMTWNGEEIPDVQGWMTFLRKANPGDVVDITVLRGGQTIPLKVTLKGRDQGAR